MADRDTLVRNFVQKTGPRAGQSYTVKRGATGLPIRVYASGDTARVKAAPPKKAFVQKTGPRAGQSFNVVQGPSGATQRKYETGDIADTADFARRRANPFAQRNRGLG